MNKEERIREFETSHLKLSRGAKKKKNLKSEEHLNPVRITTVCLFIPYGKERERKVQKIDLNNG